MSIGKVRTLRSISKLAFVSPKLKYEGVRNMNRAERRRKISATEANANNLLMYQEGINYATDAIYASVLMVLHDKFQFGRERSQRLLKLIEEQVDAVHKNYVTLNDIKEAVHTELDIQLVYSSKGAKN